MQAMGKAAASTALSMIREIVFGVGFALLLPLFFGLDGILYSGPIADISSTVIIVLFTVSEIKKLNEKAAEERAAL